MSFKGLLWAAPLALIMGACAEATDPGNNNNNGGAGPSVASVSPVDGATNVDATTTVRVTFSEAVDPASVTAAAFTVGSATGAIDVTGATATFTPDAPFAHGSGQTVRLSGVRDLDGEAMGNAFTSAFTVRTAPVNADGGDDLDASFGEAVTLDASASTGDGLSYAWSQLSGPGVGALTGDSPTFAAPSVVARLAFELTVTGAGQTSRDTVFVLVLEDKSNAYFVSPTGGDNNAGTRGAPFATLQAALDAADGQGNGGDVYLAAGTYVGSVTLRSRVSIYGGFDAATWDRDVAVFRPVIQGGPIAMQGVQANTLTLEGIEIVAADAADSGQSSVGILLDNSSDVVIRMNRILTGMGFIGRRGATGGNGAPGTKGSNGTASGICTPPRGGGGGGGSPISGRNGGGGGNGGAFGGFDGGDGAGSGGGDNGTGGGTGAQGTAGGGGDAASEGAAGAAGATVGAVTGTGYVPTRAGNGGAGGHGWGGGGGGGGGGSVVACGGGGGGGGGGGSQGFGGQGGEGGGGSIGIVLAGTSNADLTDNEIVLADGAAGGSGGNGGNGGNGGGVGTGGAGGNGGAAGRNGGAGSRGGHGGGGGGGLGGPSYGLLEGVDASSFRDNNAVTLGAGGAGGPGGTSLATGRNGAPGVAGEASEFKKAS